MGTAFYSVANPPIKAAILLEWTRIFVPTGTRNAFWWTCHILAVSLGMLFVAGIAATFMECTPYEAIWDFRVADKHCYDKHKLEISSAALHFTYDLIILILPQKVIWSLQMSVKQKLGVAAIFSVGLA